MSIETQSAEFDAVEALAKTYRDTIQSVAIVDDGYPEARFNYERALHTLFEKCQDNGRYEPGSRFGIRLASSGVPQDVLDKLSASAVTLALRNKINAMSNSREKSIALTKLDEFEMWMEKTP